jgi:hypothetical protein
MIRKKLVVMVGALVLLCVFAFPLIHSAMAKPPAPPAGPHPEIDAALHNLQEARRHLERAEPVFQGHRVEAIQHVDAAIAQIHDALRVNP